MFQKLTCLLLLLAVSACASASKPGAMMVPVSEETIISETSPLYQSMAVAAVEGGKETSPLWKSNVANEDFAEALRQSLTAHTMLAVGDAQYSVTANLVELKQPFMGFDFTVTSRVNYVVTETASSSVVLEQEITADYTAKMSDAFVGVERLRLANEGSIKDNIRQFIKALIASPAMGGVPAQAEAPTEPMS